MLEEHTWHLRIGTFVSISTEPNLSKKLFFFISLNISSSFILAKTSVKSWVYSPLAISDIFIILDPIVDGFIELFFMKNFFSCVNILLFRKNLEKNCMVKSSWWITFLNYLDKIFAFFERLDCCVITSFLCNFCLYLPPFWTFLFYFNAFFTSPANLWFRSRCRSNLITSCWQK